MRHLLHPPVRTAARRFAAVAVAAVLLTGCTAGPPAAGPPAAVRSTSGATAPAEVSAERIDVGRAAAGVQSAGMQSAGVQDIGAMTGRMASAMRTNPGAVVFRTMTLDGQATVHWGGAVQWRPGDAMTFDVTKSNYLLGGQQTRLIDVLAGTYVATLEVSQPKGPWARIHLGGSDPVSAQWSQEVTDLRYELNPVTAYQKASRTPLVKGQVTHVDLERCTLYTAELNGLQYLGMLPGSATTAKGLTAADSARARSTPVTMTFCLDANGLPLQVIETMRSPAMSMVIDTRWNHWGTPMDLRPPLPGRVVDSTTVTSA